MRDQEIIVEFTKLKQSMGILALKLQRSETLVRALFDLTGVPHAKDCATIADKEAECKCHGGMLLKMLEGIQAEHTKMREIREQMVRPV